MSSITTDFKRIKVEPETAVIASGGTESTAVACAGRVLNSIDVPSALTGTVLSLKVSYDGTTYKDYYNNAGNKIIVTPIVDTIMGLLPADMSGFLYFKVVSNSAEADARTFKFGLRGLE